MNINKWLIAALDDKKLKFLFRWLLLLSIGLIPLWHIGELINIITAPKGTHINQAAIYTPWSIVIIKNLLVPTMVLVSSLIFCLRSNRLSYNEIIALPILTAILIFAVLITPDINIWQFMAGFRWFLPFFLFITIISMNDKDLLRQLTHVLFVIMAMNLMMQLWQLGNITSGWWGWVTIEGTGFSVRNPGFFPLPATSAMFICFSTLFTFLVFKGLKTRLILGFLCLVSVFLTMSGTGFCVALIILGTLLVGNYWRILLPVIVPTSYVLTQNIISSFRGSNYFGSSLGTRQKVFFNTLEEKTTLYSSFDVTLIDWLFSANFGLGTNAAILLKNNLGIDIIAIATDSFITQLVVNLGGFSLMIYLILMTSATLLAYISGAKVTVLWLFAIGIFSVTVSITEAFPMFLLVFVALTYSIKNGDFLFRNRRLLK
ncbi:hypothetical protein OAE14_00105 [Alphaproteobacteria bacterium]|nr:hypothetical protein [Alphaproteobacteria bacterium]